MLRIANDSLPDNTLRLLESLQSRIDAEPDYPAKVKAAKEAWESKLSTRAKTEAFQMIRQRLARMCVGPVRCAYCEDSLADEVEHIRPKNFFPNLLFVWENFLFSCGPCNGPKGSRYGVVAANAVTEVLRRRGSPIVPPPQGPSALIDPRTEDPLDFLELDLGGTTPTGAELVATFELLPFTGGSAVDHARAQFTIDVLGLNREVIRVARANAFGGFRARLREYVVKKQANACNQVLDRLRDDLLSTPHLTVFAEMRRQKMFLPEIRALLDAAPEAEAWPLTPAASQP
jgi:uncharacterized protein (TIGR02646 family)